MERHLVEYLVNACWQLPLLAAGAWLLLRMVKPSPAVQHSVWLAVLGLALLLPLNGKERVKIVQPQPAAAAVQTSSFSDGAFDSIGMPRGLVLGSGGWSNVAGGVQPIFSTIRWCTRVHVLNMSATLAGWIVAIYLLVGIAGLARIVWAWRAARRLVEGSREVELTGGLKAAVADCSGRVGVKAPQVRESSEIAGPVVVGARNPVLLLPDEFKTCSEEELMAALCHEMAHIRRRDYLMNLICAGAALPLKWHPATYGVERRIRSTREMVCDAVAAKAMQSEMVYAKCLLSLAQSMVTGAEIRTGDSVAAGLFNGNAFEERMMRLLHGPTAMNVRAKLARGAMGGAGMLAALGFAAAFHVCLATAQAKPAPQTPSGVVGGVQSGVNGGVQGGVKGGLKGGVTTGQSASDTASVSQSQPIVTDLCTRDVRVATTSPVVVRVTPIVNEVRVERITPIVHVMPAVEVRPVLSNVHVSPVVNIAEVTSDVKVMKISPEIHVAPITPMVRVIPEVSDSQTAPAAPAAPAAPSTPPAPPTQAAPAAPPAPPTQAAPAAPAAPPAPPAQAAPPAPPTPPKASNADHSNCPYSMMKLTPEQRQRVEKQMEAAQRKVQESMQRLNSPEFRKQIEEAQQRALEAEKNVNSAEFQKRMADAEKHIADAQARFQSPEFKQQMEEAQRKAMEADQKMNSAEFQKQMADARNELAAARAKLNSPEFRKQIEDAQRQAEEAAQKLNSGEFQKQMADAQKKLADALAKMKADEAAAESK